VFKIGLELSVGVLCGILDENQDDSYDYRLEDSLEASRAKFKK